jgi:hypothetical protein
MADYKAEDFYALLVAPESSPTVRAIANRIIDTTAGECAHHTLTALALVVAFLRDMTGVSEHLFAEVVARIQAVHHGGELVRAEDIVFVLTKRAKA